MNKAYKRVYKLDFAIKAKTEKKHASKNREKNKGTWLYQPKDHEVLEFLSGLTSRDCVSYRSVNEPEKIRGG